MATFEEQRRLADVLRGQSMQPIQGNGAPISWSQGLNQLAQGFLGGRLSNLADRGEQKQEKLRATELDQFMRALKGDRAASPMMPGAMPSFRTPEVQGLAAQSAMSDAQRQRELADRMMLNQQEATLKQQMPQQDEYGLSPVYFRNPETGAYQIGQLGKSGSLNMLDVPEGMEVAPDSGRMGFNPTNIQERGQAELGVTLNEHQALAEQKRQQDLQAQAAQAWSRNTQKEAQIGMLTGLIEGAKEDAGMFTTGFLGSVSSKIPGTPAYDLGAKLDTIKANIGFDRLQEMRDNSPTGGALGQVSEFENRLLQAVWGNLAQSQSPSQFKENLDLVEKQVKASWDRINQAYEQDYGQPYFGSGQQVQPQGLPAMQGEVDLNEIDRILGL